VRQIALTGDLGRSLAYTLITPLIVLARRPAKRVGEWR
jgi:hypothetical protein